MDHVAALQLVLNPHVVGRYAQTVAVAQRGGHARAIHADGHEQIRPAQHDDQQRHDEGNHPLADLLERLLLAGELFFLFLFRFFLGLRFGAFALGGRLRGGFGIRFVLRGDLRRGLVQLLVFVHTSCFRPFMNSAFLSGRETCGSPARELRRPWP